MPRLVKEKATCNSTFVLFFIYLFIKSSFFFKKKNNVLFTCTFFNHQRSGWKIRLGFLAKKFIFFQHIFHLKTSNKNLFNVSKLINQLKTPLIFSKNKN
jgi:hypothetical protein